MIIRSAVLEGTVKPENRAAFDRAMRDTVLPAIRTYPGIRGVHLRRVAEADAGAPPIYMVFDLMFESLADMNAALASPTRQAVRETIAAAMPAFEGRVYHVVFDVMA